jgi:uncharacterized SAM-binding protein YcdF (DUF218 family)
MVVVMIIPESKTRAVLTQPAKAQMMVVIVLGNQLESSTIHQHLRGRVELGVRLFRQEDAEGLILTGGQTNPAVDTTEAEVMQNYAIHQGVDSDDIFIEPRGEDTVGNAYFSRRIVERHLSTNTTPTSAQTVRLATSCYHVARACYVFSIVFGDRYNIVAPDCYDSDVPTKQLDEDKSISLNRQLLAPVTPGDLEAIRDRMIETHDLYDASELTESSSRRK